jgi:hypothetical protein
MVQFGVQVDTRPASKAIYVVLLFPANATLNEHVGASVSVPSPGNKSDTSVKSFFNLDWDLPYDSISKTRRD